MFRIICGFIEVALQDISVAVFTIGKYTSQ